MDVLEAVLTGGTTEKQPFGNKGFVSLYTISYRMCSNAGSMDHSEALYERANRAIGRYLEDHVKPALGELQARVAHVQKELARKGSELVANERRKMELSGEQASLKMQLRKTLWKMPRSWMEALPKA